MSLLQQRYALTCYTEIKITHNTVAPVNHHSASAIHSVRMFTLAVFGLIHKVKWFSAQSKLSSRGLSYLCRVKPSGLSL